MFGRRPDDTRFEVGLNCWGIVGKIWLNVPVNGPVIGSPGNCEDGPVPK